MRHYVRFFGPSPRPCRPASHRLRPGGTSKEHMPHRVAPPALPPVLLSMARFTQAQQVCLVRCDLRIPHVVSCQRFLVMHMHSRLDQSFCQAKLTQPSALLQYRSPAGTPQPRSVEALYLWIVMHCVTSKDKRNSCPCPPNMNSCPRKEKPNDKQETFNP